MLPQVDITSADCRKGLVKSLSLVEDISCNVPKVVKVKYSFEFSRLGIACSDVLGCTLEGLILLTCRCTCSTGTKPFYTGIIVLLYIWCIYWYFSGRDSTMLLPHFGRGVV